MKPTLAQALKRIEELERRVLYLESQVVHVQPLHVPEYPPNQLPGYGTPNTTTVPPWWRTPGPMCKGWGG